MNKQLVLRRIAAIVGVALLASACSERVVDMDGTRPVVDAEATKGAAEDVVVVLNEQVNELQSDGTRLFWYGQQPDVPCTENHAFAVRSCIIGDCANTLVTYANWLVSCSTPADIQDTAGRAVVPSGTVAGTLGRITTDGLKYLLGNGALLLSHIGMRSKVACRVLGQHEDRACDGREAVLVEQL